MSFNIVSGHSSTLVSSRRALQKISLQAATRHGPIAFDPEGSPLNPYRAAGSSRKKFILLIDEIRGGLIGFKLLTHQWRAIGAANPFDAFRSAKELPVGPAGYFGQLFSR